MAYATPNDVAKRYTGTFDAEVCNALLEDAAEIIDAYSPEALPKYKNIVSVRMVVRALSSDGVPVGTTQATQSALGYSQTYLIGGGGSVGELYVTKSDKKLLGIASRIGASSPLEAL